MRPLAICLLLAAFAAAAPAAEREPPPRFAAALERALDSDAEWTMAKRLASPPIALVSTGSVSCCAGRGIAWETRAPFMQLIRMTTNEMIFVTERDTVVKRLDESPYYGRIRAEADRFMAGARDSFSRAFDWEWEPSPEAPDGLRIAAGSSQQDDSTASRNQQSASHQWRMTVRPKEARLAKFMPRAVLVGSETLESATLFYADGSAAEIHFRETARHGHALWKIPPETDGAKTRGNRK